MTLLCSKTWSFNEKTSVTKVAKYNVNPVNPTFSKQTAPTVADLKALRNIAVTELETNFTAEANLPSYYFSGKKLGKQAHQCITLSSILKDKNLTAQCTSQAQEALLLFVQGKQEASALVYDKTWRGIISSMYIKTGNEYDDFGNGVYNDHHFHWGYFVHSASVLSSLDSSFAAKVAPYINSMIRDVNNPSAEDTYFPFSRTFDWYFGHSIASGLQSVQDGKNQESASEDINFFYGMKIWGEVTKNPTLTALANLQLGIMRRAFNTYYLLTDSNTVQPSQFIRNRVSGILFENKVDYTTFFSSLKEAIHMIQAIPTTPLMPFWRDLEFVKQEWSDSGPKGDVQISELAETKSTGYRTLLYTQYAVLQPRQIADGLITNPNATVLDDGASLTWSLGFALSQLGKTGGK